jgi:hypothetical protein
MITVKPSVARGATLVLLTAALVAGTAGIAAAKPKKQSTAKYAKLVCGTYSRLETDVTQYATSVGNIDQSDATAFQNQAAAQTTTLIATVKAAEKALSGAYPDISNGKKVGTLLVTNARELDDALTTALSKLQAGGPAAAIQFGVQIQILGAKISDPFSRVTDQDLIHAFGKEKSCKNVVQVIGG